MLPISINSKKKNLKPNAKLIY